PELRPYSAARSVTARRLYPSGGISVPAVIDLSLVAVGLGALVLLRLAGGSLPWGHLSIAVGPDGRPMRPRVKWHLWSVSRGESPRSAALAGFTSLALGVTSVAAVTPRIAQLVLRPVPSKETSLLVFIAAMGCILFPLGVTVLLRGLMDVLARRATMSGMVVGLRRDLGMLGHSYPVAIQPGSRSLAPGLWAAAFRSNRAAVKSLSPADRGPTEYSARQHHVQ